MWQQIIINGIVASVIFNTTVALLWLKLPNAMSVIMPLEIRQAAPRPAKNEVATLYISLALLYGSLLAYIVITVSAAGVTGFWNLFWMGYLITFIVNMVDFWVLDIWFRERFKARLMIKGTEHCKAWQTQEWLRTMAIPGHWVAWPLVVCPAVGFLVTVVSSAGV